MNKKKRIIVSVTNDLLTDQRVNKICAFLTQQSLEVILVGRKLKNSPPYFSQLFASKRFCLFFNKGFLFYAEFNIRLFLFILFNRYDALLANDLDTLPANFFANLIRRKKIYYDSHEIFTEVPELIKHPFKRKIWLSFEKFILPKLKICYTVNQSIANYFYEVYTKKFYVIKNYPNSLKINKINKVELGLPLAQKIIILQGSGININRGAEEIIQAMQFLENTILLIIGSGDVVAHLKQLVISLRIKDRVIFKNRMPYSEMMTYTACADLGISLDKPIGLNYKYSLPNKLFDYLQAEIPVLVSNLPEVSAVVTTYKVGEIIDTWEPKIIAEKINYTLEKSLQRHYMPNIKYAKKELVWENQTATLKEIYFDLLNS